MFLDFSNAFNTLPRQGLLNKFAATNPPYWLVKWVHNYFTGHSQYIRAHNKVFAKKLRRLSTPAEYIRKFAEVCVIPIILYCSPAIFSELLKQDMRNYQSQGATHLHQ